MTSKVGRKELGHAAATERAVSGPRTQSRLMIAPSTLPAMSASIVGDPAPAPAQAVREAADRERSPGNAAHRLQSLSQGARVTEPRRLVLGILCCRHAGAAVGLTVALAAVGCGGSSSPAAPTAVPPSPQFVEASFREAARITAAAQVAVLQAAKPGVFERDIKAVIDAAYAREGSGPPAFAHITASGPNALELHYAGDARQLVGGDLLLVDIGATSNQHCADVTRTYPVSGRFTDRQRAIYQLVLDAQALALTRARVGVDSLASIGTAVRDFLRSSPLRAKNTAGVESTMDTFFVHSLSHYVGRQVHGEDTGWNPSQPIQPDQVFVFEPGLYIASEGIGIRIEDTFLATRAGLECLSCASPKGTSEVERLP